MGYTLTGVRGDTPVSAHHNQLDLSLPHQQQPGRGGTARLPGGGRDAYGARGGRGEYHHLCGFLALAFPCVFWRETDPVSDALQQFGESL